MESSPAWMPPTEGGFSGGDDTVYDTVDELVGKSDLILVGTVMESVVGEVFDDDAEYPTRIVHTTVAVEEALKGSGSEGDVMVPTDELAFVGNEDDWREPGYRVLLFLTPSRERDEPFYILSNVNYLQTTYFVDGDEIEPGMESHTDITGLSERVAAMTLPELREFIDAASK